VANDHRVHGVVCDDGSVIRLAKYARILSGELGEPFASCIADRVQACSLHTDEVACEVRAPVPEADERNVDAHTSRFTDSTTYSICSLRSSG